MAESLMIEQANPVLEPDRFTPLQEADFQPVDPAYLKQLRLTLLPVLLLAAPLGWQLYQLPISLPLVASLALLIPGVAVLLMALFWAPRRYWLTGYCLRQHDLHLRTGALWRCTTSVTLNRIQHLEVSQGPLERLLGIARLLVYTAGGSGQDLAIPGLAKARADQLRLHVLQQLGEPEAGEREAAEGDA
ncbi:PH domain-containing protein [Halomonas sp. TBZ9]|uniref:PH domain-containing protein n=2 Tax=Vreelandella azerica TaxID=2732867 RepID=A0A7Y3TX99_9GAMM|nr:PH domain-containing protein [Halomonas azerica]